MFLLLILFFIIFIVSYVLVIYKLKLIEDDIDILYEKYSEYIANNFNLGGNKND